MWFAEGSEKKGETVVLLHGMGRSRASLLVLQYALTRAGYETCNFPYSPPLESLDQITDRLKEYIRERVDTPAYHFVGHSLGNIIVRNGFKGSYPPGLERIVMLAPPNHPPVLAQSLKDNPLYRILNGDSGQKLASPGFYENLPVPHVEFGVIAGDRGQKMTFKGPNDGIVLVEHTRLEGMKDWILVNHSHTFMMNCADTIKYCINFLEEGEFSLNRH